MEDESYRKLKEGDSSGVKRHLLDGLGQLKRRLQALAQWYGLPYREERLYSAICPRCGAKMEKKRIMRCPVASQTTETTSRCCGPGGLGDPSEVTRFFGDYHAFKLVSFMCL